MTHIQWTGDLDDDCTASFDGLLLRAEAMDDYLWWWAVYGPAPFRTEIASSGGRPNCTTGSQARAAAEAEAISRRMDDG
jgi:hypothetical protein